MEDMFSTFAEYRQSTGGYIVVLSGVEFDDIYGRERINTCSPQYGYNTYLVNDVIEQTYDGEKYLYILADKDITN